jgi:hypothetical protein
MIGRVWLVALTCCGSKDAPPAGAASDQPRRDAGADGAAVAAVAPCLDEDKLDPGFSPRLVAAADGPRIRVCMAYRDNDDVPHRACVAIELETGAAIGAPEDEELPEQPAAGLPEGRLDRSDGPRACGAGGACRALGRKAARAVAAAERVAVTADGALVIVSNNARSEVWSVARDRRLTLAPPREVEREYRPYGTFHPVGRNVLGGWTPCAGPCTVNRVFSPSGRSVAEFSSELGPVAIDEGRWGVLGASELRMFDLETGRAQGEISFVPAGDDHAYEVDGVGYRWDWGDPEEPVLLRLDAGRVAVVTRTEPLITIIDTRSRALVRRYRVPVCGDDDHARDAAALASDR